MPKETFYFAHDYSASNNPKISAMISDYNAWGYGVYWHIIELLHQNDDHKLPLKPHTYKAIAKQMLTNAEQVLKFIEDCANEYELLYLNDGFFFADRVNKNIEKRLEISEKRSFAAKKSVEVRKQNSANAEQVLANAEQNPAKERKGKETTIKSSSVFTPPLIEEVRAYFEENGYSTQSAETAFNFYSSANWVDSKGNKVRSWKQKMISVWFKPENTSAEKVYQINKPIVIDHRKTSGKW